MIATAACGNDANGLSQLSIFTWEVVCNPTRKNDFMAALDAAVVILFEGRNLWWVGGSTAVDPESKLINI